jgi:hypothetical protein
MDEQRKPTGDHQSPETKANGEITPARERTRGLKAPWKKGQSGNSAGRPVGARHKFSEAFCKDLLRAWQEHGYQALVRAAQDNPVAFISVAARVLPRDYGFEDRASYQGHEWIEIIARLSRQKAREALQ